MTKGIVCTGNIPPAEGSVCPVTTLGKFGWGNNILLVVREFEKIRDNLFVITGDKHTYILIITKDDTNVVRLKSDPNTDGIKVCPINNGWRNFGKTFTLRDVILEEVYPGLWIIKTNNTTYVGIKK